MATTKKPRITFKRQSPNIEAYTIYADGKTIANSNDSTDESWVNFSSGGLYPYDCNLFLYIGDRLTAYYFPATPETIPDTLKALRPLIQQAIINGALQAAGALNESK